MSLKISRHLTKACEDSLDENLLGEELDNELDEELGEGTRRLV